MTQELFFKLCRGDWVQTDTDVIGCIQYFAKYNGIRWVKASKREANGIYLNVPFGHSGYVSYINLKQYLPAPPLFFVYGPGGEIVRDPGVMLKALITNRSGDIRR